MRAYICSCMHPPLPPPPPTHTHSFSRTHMYMYTRCPPRWGVVKTHRMPCLYRSLSAKEPLIIRLFCGKWPMRWIQDGEWWRPIGCLVFTGHFLQKSHYLYGSFTENHQWDGYTMPLFYFRTGVAAHIYDREAHTEGRGIHRYMAGEHICMAGGHT